MHAVSLLPLSLLTTASALTVWVSEVVTQTQYHSLEVQVVVDNAGNPWTTITKDAVPVTSSPSLPQSSPTSPVIAPVVSSSTSSSASIVTSATYIPAPITSTSISITTSSSASPTPSHHSHALDYNYIPIDTSATSNEVTTSPELALTTTVPTTASSLAPASSTPIFSSTSISTPTTSSTTAAAATTASGTQFSGDATFYDVGLGACGVTNTDSELIAALNKDQWEQFGSMSNGNPACGKQARISYQGKSVTVTIQDKCPGCAHGDLDLSPAAFQQLADEGAGRIQMTWSFV